jgi:hypothetical protein
MEFLVLRNPVPVFISDALRGCPALQLRALEGSQVRMTRAGTLSLRYEPVKSILQDVGASNELCLNMLTKST